MSDHYLDERALGFLGGVAAKIRAVSADTASAQHLFMYYAVQTLPGLGRADVDPRHRAEVERALGSAKIPTLPNDLEFRFDVTLEKRSKGPWWKLWKR